MGRETFESLYERVIKKNKGEDALIYFENKERKTLSFDEFDTLILKYAEYFERHIEKKDKETWIGLKLLNSYNWFINFFALQMAGFNVVLLDDNATPELMEHFIRQTGMKAVISDKEESYLKDTIIKINVNEVSEGIHECTGRIKSNWSSKIAFCTSGTTGTAKVYVFDAQAIVFSGENIVKFYQINSDKIPENSTDKKSILVLPFRHISGFIMAIAFWMMGKCLVLPKSKGILSIIETVREEEIWLLFCVPAMWEAIIRIIKSKYGYINEKAFEEVMGKYLKMGVSAAASLNEDLIVRLSETGIKLLNCWGMTEIGLCTAGWIDESKENGYVGAPINEHKIEIITDSGVVENGVGEVIVSGDALFTTMMVDGIEIKRDSKYKTGDIFKYENGKLFFLGRNKNVIIGESGENVYPEEIDCYFDWMSDFVNKYCTIGEDDAPVMFISVKNSKEFLQSEEFKRLKAENRKLPLIKQITKIHILEDHMPCTTKGEVSRVGLKGKEIKEKIKETIVLKGNKI